MAAEKRRCLRECSLPRRRAAKAFTSILSSSLIVERSSRSLENPRRGRRFGVRGHALPMPKFRHLRSKLAVLYAGLFGAILLLIAVLALAAVSENAQHVVRRELATSRPNSIR